MLVLIYFLGSLFLTACGIDREQSKQDESHEKKRIEDESRYSAVIADLEDCAINGKSDSDCTTATITARKLGIPENEIESLLQKHLNRRSASERSNEKYRTPISADSTNKCNLSITVASDCQTVKSAGETLPEDVDSRIEILREKDHTNRNAEETRTVLIGKPITANQ